MINKYICHIHLKNKIIMMKSKNIVLHLFTILIVFCACGNEEENLQKAACSLSLKTESTFSGQKNEQFGVVPEVVAAQMDADELAVWHKIGLHYYIDSVFLSSRYYKIHKKDILDRIQNLCKANNTKTDVPRKLMFMTNGVNGNIVLISDTMDVLVPDVNDSIPEYPINCDGFFATHFETSVNRTTVRINVSVNVHFTGTNKNPVYEIISKNVTYEPEGVKLSGYVEFTPVAEGLNFTIKGRLWYRSYYTEIYEPYTFVIFPKC